MVFRAVGHVGKAYRLPFQKAGAEVRASGFGVWLLTERQSEASRWVVVLQERVWWSSRWIVRSVRQWSEKHEYTEPFEYK